MFILDPGFYKGIDQIITLFQKLFPMFNPSSGTYPLFLSQISTHFMNKVCDRIESLFRSKLKPNKVCEDLTEETCL